MTSDVSKNATENRKWSRADIPDQSGRVVVVTGANTGLGYHTAAVLAFRGAHVVLAVRSPEKGNSALARIVAAKPQADITLQELDLSSLDSVRAAAEALRSTYPRIDLLINNAGVMWTPKQTTKDGFEMQFGTNHLGHFALTGLLLDRLLPVRGSRVVTVSSLGHRIRAAIHFDDLQWERGYDRIAAYGQSKLANLLFTYELQRRLAADPTPPPSPWPPTRAAPTPNWPATCHGLCGRCRTSSARCCSKARRWVRCRRCGPPPIRRWRVGSTTAPTVSSSNVATRSWCSPARRPMTKSCNAGCGRSPRNSPASAFRCSGP